MAYFPRSYCAPSAIFQRYLSVVLAYLQRPYSDIIAALQRPIPLVLPGLLPICAWSPTGQTLIRAWCKPCHRSLKKKCNQAVYHLRNIHYLPTTPVNNLNPTPNRCLSSTANGDCASSATKSRACIPHNQLPLTTKKTASRTTQKDL